LGTPLRYGAGIKGKVLGAMSAGVPVVTTTIGAEGIGLESGVSVFVEDSDEGFAEAVHRLTTDEELWGQIRLAAREMVEGELSFDRFQASVADLMKRLASVAASGSTQSRRALS
jgi:glycosyltransferase involved in cell wall biosynthesis